VLLSKQTNDTRVGREGSGDIGNGTVQVMSLSPLGVHLFTFVLDNVNRSAEMFSSSLEFRRWPMQRIA
jgi:hypothetical protein